MRISWLLVLASLLVGSAPWCAAASTSEPVVYISPDGSGARPSTTPWLLPAADGQQLVLYLDVDRQDGTPPAPSMNGKTLCVGAEGDETCGFDVTIAMTTDTAKFVNFAAPGTNVGQIDAAETTLQVNGVDIAGMNPILPGGGLGPALIGTLTLNAAGATQLSISVTGQRVGAAGQLEVIQSQKIGILPEPGVLWQLASGVGALGWLARRRARSRAAR